MSFDIRHALDDVIQQINSTGYGLTLGIHSRIEKTIHYIQSHVQVGNIYVNRNMIGAVVGVQPFGGENLSGTGPKAGGPHYLLRLVIERTRVIRASLAEYGVDAAGGGVGWIRARTLLVIHKTNGMTVICFFPCQQLLNILLMSQKHQSA